MVPPQVVPPSWWVDNRWWEPAEPGTPAYLEDILVATNGQWPSLPKEDVRQTMRSFPPDSNHVALPLFTILKTHFPVSLPQIVMPDSVAKPLAAFHAAFTAGPDAGAAGKKRLRFVHSLSTAAVRFSAKRLGPGTSDAASGAVDGCYLLMMTGAQAAILSLFTSKRRTIDVAAVAAETKIAEDEAARLLQTLASAISPPDGYSGAFNQSRARVLVEVPTAGGAESSSASSSAAAANQARKAYSVNPNFAYPSSHAYVPASVRALPQVATVRHPPAASSQSFLLCSFSLSDVHLISFALSSVIFSIPAQESAKQMTLDKPAVIEAAIVRLLKRSKSMQHDALVAAVGEAVPFQLDPAQFKQGIENLIKREYIERDSKKHDVYKYA